MQQYSNSLFRQFPNSVSGNAAIGVSVSVYERGTTNLVTLYANDDVGGATLPNPLTTNNIGFYSFYAPDGKYTLHFGSSQFPDLNIELIDGEDLVYEFNALESSTDARVLSLGSRTQKMFPLVISKNANGESIVPIWLDNGKLDGFGLGGNFTAENTAIADQRALLAEAERNQSIFPIVKMSNGVPLWCEAGSIGFGALTDKTIDYLNTVVTGGGAAPVSPTEYVTSSGGRFIRAIKAAMGLKLAGGSVVIKIGMVGDSWCEFKVIPQYLAELLYAVYGKSADGYVSLNVGAQLNSTLLTNANWTSYDASNGALPARGCGPDGQAIYTTGTTATASVSNSQFTQFTLYYWDGNGTFRYRVDAGAWQEVVCGNTGVKTSLLVNGLSDANHTIEIDTTTNTGTVELYGLLLERPAASGVLVSKIGNGSTTGNNYSMIKSQIEWWSDKLNFHGVGVILGTNDSRGGNGSPAGLAQGITDLVAAWRYANTSCGAFYTFPPQHGQTITGGTSEQYRDAAIAACKLINVDWFSAFDEWDIYSVENTRNQWSDALHLSNAGAKRLAYSINNRILEI